MARTSRIISRSAAVSLSISDYAGIRLCNSRTCPRGKSRNSIAPPTSPDATRYVSLSCRRVSFREATRAYPTPSCRRTTTSSIHAWDRVRRFRKRQDQPARRLWAFPRCHHGADIQSSTHLAAKLGAGGYYRPAEFCRSVSGRVQSVPGDAAHLAVTGIPHAVPAGGVRSQLHVSIHPPVESHTRAKPARKRCAAG